MWLPPYSSQPLLEADFGFQREKKWAETKWNHAQAFQTRGWQLEFGPQGYGSHCGNKLGRAGTPLRRPDSPGIVYSNYWD